MQWRLASWGLVLLGLVVGAGPASALNILSLSTTTPTVDVGDPVQLTLGMSFDEVTLGGGVRLSFDDTLLSLTSISFGGALGDDPDFRCPTAGGPVSCPADPNFISFGGFAGLSGDRTVATIILQALAPTAGGTTIDLLADRAFSDNFGSPLTVSLTGTSVVVVPEPGTLALVGLGLASLTAVRRRSA